VLSDNCWLHCYALIDLFNGGEVIIYSPMNGVLGRIPINKLLERGMSKENNDWFGEHDLNWKANIDLKTKKVIEYILPNGKSLKRRYADKKRGVFMTEMISRELADKIKSKLTNFTACTPQEVQDKYQSWMDKVFELESFIDFIINFITEPETELPKVNIGGAIAKVYNKNKPEKEYRMSKETEDKIKKWTETLTKPEKIEPLDKKYTEGEVELNGSYINHQTANSRKINEIIKVLKKEVF
jgi:hypothetical protein